MKLLSWNVNGFRALQRKMDVRQWLEQVAPDVMCFQETKLQLDQVKITTPGYHQYWNCADKKGYSGTAIFTRQEPLHVTRGMGIDQHDHEGRLITAEFENFYLLTVYTPNAQPGLRRLAYRLEWGSDFLRYVQKLDAEKPVVFCGDLNVAHQEIDLKNPRTNRQNPGFSIEEREDFTTLLNGGFVDSFRYLYPDQEGAYSWWSYRGNARSRNTGWRIDYFVVSRRLADKIKDARILSDVFGSDHCPVALDIDL